MNKIVKTLFSFLIVFGLVFNSFNNPQRAEALFGIGDIVFDPTIFVKMITDRIEDYSKKALLSTLKEATIKMIEKQTLSWINGGFDGTPLFLQNPESFFKNITVNQLALVKKSAIGDLTNASNILTSELRAANKDITKSLIDEVVNKKANFQDSLLPTYNTDICKKLTADIKMYTEMASSTDIEAEKKGWKDNVDISKEKYKQNCNANTKEKKAEQIANNKECIASFACSGWGGILAVTQNPAQNTDAGRAGAIKNNFEENKAAAEKKANDQLDRGSGYLDQTECLKKETVEKRDICMSFRTVNPGQVALSAVDGVIKRPLQQAVTETDPLASFFTTVTNAAMSKIMDMGIEEAKKAVSNLSDEIDKNVTSLTGDLGITVKTDGTTKVIGTSTGRGGLTDVDVSGAELTDDQRQEILSQLKPLITLYSSMNRDEVEALDRLIAAYKQVFDAHTQVATCYNNKKISIPQNIKNRASELNSIMLSLKNVRDTAVQADIDLTNKYNTLVTTKNTKSFSDLMIEIQKIPTGGKLLIVYKYKTQEGTTLYADLNKETEKMVGVIGSELAKCRAINTIN